MNGVRIEAMINAAVFGALGIALFAGAFVTMRRLTPFQVWAEIVEKQNVAAALVVSAMTLGAAIIIAAAVH
jgi:uncharacterized membrane protein YjfL (UPF0719 family)